MHYDITDTIFWVFQVPALWKSKIIRDTTCLAHISWLLHKNTGSIYYLSTVKASYFSTLSHKRQDLKKKKFFNIKCVFPVSLQLLSQAFLILRRTEQNMIKIVYWSSCEVPLFLYNFNKTWTFLTDFQKILKYQLSWQSTWWEPSCSMQTDITKLMVTFRNYVNVPKYNDWEIQTSVVPFDVLIAMSINTMTPLGYLVRLNWVLIFNVPWDTMALSGIT